MPTNLAADARTAVRNRPFLYDALRAGVVNYAAAARTLDIEGDPEAVAAALRRYAEELPDIETGARDVRVTMESGLGESEEEEEREGVLAVNGTGYASGAGSLTGVLATGEVDTTALRAVLGRLDTAGVDAEAAGVASDALLVVVGRRDGPDAVRAVEGALGTVPA